MADFSNLITGIMPTLKDVGGLVSAGSGLYNTYQNQKYQDMLRSYAQNPQKLMNYARGFTQPLSAGLLQGVENQAQGYAAERGLATSPAQEQQIVSQAIAPYIQQQQNQGLQTALQALGLGGGAQPNPGGGFDSLTKGLESLADLFKPKPQGPFNSPVLDSSTWGPSPPSITDWSGMAGFGDSAPDLSIFNNPVPGVGPEWTGPAAAYGG